MKSPIAMICLLTVSSAVVQAQTIGNPAKGLQLARDQCASCHQVEQGQSVITHQAANFFEIAQTPGMTELALSVWFRTPHRHMPNLILSEADQDDLISYIVSLKSQK